MCRFHSAGIEEVSIDRWKICDSGWLIASAHFFKIIAGMLSGPGEMFERSLLSFVVIVLASNRTSDNLASESELIARIWAELVGSIAVEWIEEKYSANRSAASISVLVIPVEACICRIGPPALRRFDSRLWNAFGFFSDSSANSI